MGHNRHRLLLLSPSMLEEEANLLLYGHRKITEAADLPEVFFRPYQPVMTAITYQVPRVYYNFRSSLICRLCFKPRSKYSAEVCRACYRRRARGKLHEVVEGLSWLERQIGSGSVWLFATENVVCSL